LTITYEIIKASEHLDRNQIKENPQNHQITIYNYLLSMMKKSPQKSSNHYLQLSSINDEEKHTKIIKSLSKE
jgi:hypothetical protein